MTHSPRFQRLAAAEAETEAWLRKRNLPFKRPTTRQFKIGRNVSYYPGTGTIFVDGEQQGRDETGLAALEVALRAEGLLGTPSRRPPHPGLPTQTYLNSPTPHPTLKTQGCSTLSSCRH